MSALVLGAGMVTGPLFEYLNGHDISFSVVSCLEKELQWVKSRYPDVACYCLDVADQQLPTLISQHQLVINLFLPALLSQVAKMCIEQQRPMLSASYVDLELSKLSTRAEEAGVLLLSECGLDPGLDHMLAMEVIDKVVADGGQITSFTSWCGGIPAPDCANNPLQYKFSWNPKGALMSNCRDAAYLHNGQLVKVAGSQIQDKTHPVETSSLLPGTKLEGFPNKFFSHHLSAYGLENIGNFFRGTLRYQKNLMSFLATGSPDKSNFEQELLSKLENSVSRMEALRGLGLLSDMEVKKLGTPFDALAAHLQDTLIYTPGERDMIVMQHEIACRHGDQQQEVKRVGLVVYGDPNGHSAMAKTVGYPVGVVAEMILQGKIQRKGVVLPTTPDIYQPVLTAMKDLGISAQMTAQIS